MDAQAGDGEVANGCRVAKRKGWLCTTLAELKEKDRGNLVGQKGAKVQQGIWNHKVSKQPTKPP